MPLVYLHPTSFVVVVDVLVVVMVVSVTQRVLSLTTPQNQNFRAPASHATDCESANHGFSLQTSQVFSGMLPRFMGHKDKRENPCSLEKFGMHRGPFA